LNLNLYDKAITDHTKAIELNPNNAQAYNDRGDVYSIVGKNKEAEADYAKAKMLNEAN
jgi:Flp pilus assembly protein TadD